MFSVSFWWSISNKHRRCVVESTLTFSYHEVGKFVELVRFYFSECVFLCFHSKGVRAFQKAFLLNTGGQKKREIERRVRVATPTLFLCTSFAKFRPTAYHMWTASYRRMSSTCRWPSELKARLLVDEPYRSKAQGSTEDVPSDDTDAAQDFVKYMYNLMTRASISSEKMLKYLKGNSPTDPSSTNMYPTPIEDAHIYAFRETFQSEDNIKSFSIQYMIQYMNARGGIDARLLDAFIEILKSDEQVCTAVQEYVGVKFTNMRNALTNEDGSINYSMKEEVIAILKEFEEEFGLEMCAQKLIVERLYAL